MANINVRLGKNFTTAFNKMQAEYGEEFARLNGFADEQLSFTDFIDNFIDSETVADASVDGNANVGAKDMRTLMNEMPKSHRKLLAFNKIYYELNKKYGFKTANEWLEAEWNKSLYMHDADTSTYVHYCFAYDLKDLAESGTEVEIWVNIHSAADTVTEEEKQMVAVFNRYCCNCFNYFIKRIFII